MTDAHYLPLEKALFKAAQENPHSFPGSFDYADRYKHKLKALRQTIYQSIDSGLTALSKDAGGIYTGHDSRHFDEVVKYAGELVGENHGLSPFELYLLLMSIRVHDVGNICGRDEHETRCLDVLGALSDISDDRFEIQLISKIAGAHGGRHITHGKDTIGALPRNEPIDSLIIRPQLLAAITRFADEICETSRRASTFLLLKNLLPEKSEIYHQYAHTVKASVINADRVLHLTYNIEQKLLPKTWEVSGETGTQNLYLSDYVLDRLEKINTERIYYNQFVDNKYQVFDIEAKIMIVNERGDPFTSETIKTARAGYPTKTTNNPWRANYTHLQGSVLLTTFPLAP